MTDQLKHALDDLAAQAPAGDRVDPGSAWVAAGRRRGNRTALVAGGLAVAVAVTAGVLQGTRTGPGPGPVAATPSPRPTSSAGPALPSPSPPPAATPGGSYGEAAVWWAPPATREPSLDWLASRLPRSIDLTGDRHPVHQAGTAALGLFVLTDAETGEPNRLLLLTAQGELRSLAADHLSAYQDESGNGAALVPLNGGLSPDGWTLFIAQLDAVEIYDLRTGRWRSLPAPAWAAEQARWLDGTTLWVPDAPGVATGSTWAPDGTRIAGRVDWHPPALAQAADDQPYGIWVDGPDVVAGSYFLAGPVAGGPVSNPEGIIARTGRGTAVLALAQQDRGKMCCAVAGWLGSDTLAFGSGTRLLAWEVGSGRLYRVSGFTGVGQEEHLRQSWAWHALG